MIIEKIEIENFACFSGKNSFSFKEGINVIIGDNGYGKSQLYNAFYWVMYDQLFVKEQDDFISTKVLKSKIISDKAKFGVTSGKICASVIITFHNLEKDNVYILERKYTVTKNDGKLIESNDSEFIVMQKELSGLTARLVHDEETKENIKRRILPSDFKPYLWFQGEQVESIIDFNKKDSLTQAINVLSNIKQYDELKCIASALAKSSNNEYDRELKRLSKDINKSEQLEKDKDYLEIEISDLQLEKKEIEENLSRAETKCDELLSKQADATKISELQEKKKGLVNLLNELNESLKEEQISFHRKMFRNKWVLKGTEDLQKDYAKRFSSYEQMKLQIAAEDAARKKVENETASNLQTRLPFNVPEPNYLEWMLDKERCLVCDREAKRNTEPWMKIKELLDRPENISKNKDDKPLSIHNFNDDFKRLYTNGLALGNRIKDINDEIQETLKKRQTLIDKVKETNRELQKNEDDIKKLLTDSALTAEGATHILDEYSIQNNYVRGFSEKRIKITQQIEQLKSNLKNVNAVLKSLVTGEIPKWLVEKKEVLNDFETIAETTRDRVFNNLIQQLENEANKHYMAMTANNKSSRGRIKLRKTLGGNYMPEIVDDNNIPLPGYNASNLILVKLSAIMAIISAKSNTGIVDFYTLIADAPTSVFGEDYTIGFCETISKVYKQSIIMSKEFYKNESLRKELLSSPNVKIGKVYTIAPSISERERSNRNHLSTKINLLN
jgi:DNA sulfur modification protein DndD